MQESELILNPDGSVYHLAVLPHQIAPLLITVGDPNRVDMVSQYFDEVSFKQSNREFVIHTGTYNNTPITCMSTGMGTDNIDIVMNELDALFNIDLRTRQIKKEHIQLTIVRIGTSGSIRADIPVGSVLATEIAIGLESLFSWYQTPSPSDLEQRWFDHLDDVSLPIRPFVFECDQGLLALFKEDYTPGVTLTTGGFYAPQNRCLRLNAAVDVVELLKHIRVGGQYVTNIEMETAGIYGLSKMLGHRALSINAIMANRLSGEFAKNPEEIMVATIQHTLNTLCKS